MIGNWKGWYKYDNVKLQFVNSAKQYGFVVSIETFDGIKFSGSVRDDSFSSPMKETGRVEGTIDGNIIFFRKLMPVNYTFTLDGNYTSRDKPHPVIYYKGTIDKSEMTATGHWYFKKKLAFLFLFIPVLYCPGRGTWQMSLLVAD